MYLNTPTLTTFVVYIVLMLAIGFVAYRATRNFSDYILGGRRLGSVVTALSAGASDMSGWLLMGLPGAVYLTGISASWIAIGLIIGAWCNWYFVAGRLRLQTEYHANSLTLPDYLTARFDDRTRLLRLLSALVILVFFTIYCASGIVAGARLFESTFGLDYHTALWAGAAATIVYTFIGGFLAVSWTDTVQATLMIFALLLAPMVVIFACGGAGPAITLIRQVDVQHLNLLRDASIMGVISSMGWGLGYFGQPHILARFMAADSVKTMRSARRIGMTWMVLCLGGAVAVGFFGIAYFAAHPEHNTLGGNPERIFIVLSQLLFNPWLAGVVLAAILAAVMSTLSCQLLVSASALTEDLYKAFLRPGASQRELVWIGRAMVLLVAAVAIALARNPDAQVLGLVSYAWAGFGAAFGPVILLSVLWPRMSAAGAFAGMLVGATTVIVWKNMAWFGLYEIIPGFVFATLAIGVVSHLTPAPGQPVQARFDDARRTYHG